MHCSRGQCRDSSIAIMIASVTVGTLLQPSRSGLSSAGVRLTWCSWHESHDPGVTWVLKFTSRTSVKQRASRLASVRTRATMNTSEKLKFEGDIERWLVCLLLELELKSSNSWTVKTELQFQVAPSVRMDCAPHWKVLSNACAVYIHGSMRRQI